ncbi:MAG: hypothetical protein ACK2TW_06005 [Anaerolineales bacterium]
MGYKRAGFYGYDLIENLGSQSGIKSAEGIIPEFQAYKAGNPFPISAVHTMKFYTVESYRYLIWAGQENEGSYLWILQPDDSGGSD